MSSGGDRQRRPEEVPFQEQTDEPGRQHQRLERNAKTLALINEEFSIANSLVLERIGSVPFSWLTEYRRTGTLPLVGGLSLLTCCPHPVEGSHDYRMLVADSVRLGAAYRLARETILSFTIHSLGCPDVQRVEKGEHPDHQRRNRDKKKFHNGPLLLPNR